MRDDGNRIGLNYGLLAVVGHRTYVTRATDGETGETGQTAVICVTSGKAVLKMLPATNFSTYAAAMMASRTVLMRGVNRGD